MVKTVTLKLAVVGGWLNYVLSPGCTITRSITKDLQIYPISGGEPAQLMTMGSTESDTIRIDTKVSVSNTSSDPTQPSYVDIFTLAANFKAVQTDFPPDHLLWGEDVDLEGRIKNIVITQRSGEGDLADLAIIFEVGECVASKE